MVVSGPLKKKMLLHITKLNGKVSQLSKLCKFTSISRLTNKMYLKDMDYQTGKTFNIHRMKQ